VFVFFVCNKQRSSAMKVILNKDLAPLGEEGDIKEVAKGYARNFLFPRGIAMPYTDSTLALLESRREEIEARKEEKRQDALGMKEKLEELALVIAMPAGANGRLYGAVTGQTIADELARQGFPIERKRIELPGNSFKSVGKYKISVKLYEGAAAELALTVEGQQLKVETPTTSARRDRRRRDEAPASVGAEAATETAPGEGALTEGAITEAVPEGVSATETVTESAPGDATAPVVGPETVGLATGGPATDDPETAGPETVGPATDGPATDGPATGAEAGAPEPVPETGAVEA
jgi:large subunit ribosomal protein L9